MVIVVAWVYYKYWGICEAWRRIWIH